MSFVVLDTDVASGAVRGNLPGRYTKDFADLAAFDGLGLIDVT